jgi:histidinol dehydrogenase
MDFVKRSRLSAMPRRFDNTKIDFQHEFEGFFGRPRAAQEDVGVAVASILKDVLTRGDLAVRDYTRRFDSFDLPDGDYRISEDDIEAAANLCPADVRDALAVAAERIDAFHRNQLPEREIYTDAAGIILGARWTPIDAVGLYVPGGQAAYPSSVLMNAIPAKVAGVPRVAMMAPMPEGKLNPHVMAAVKLAGVTEIFPVGGAQAIAALAHGTDIVAPVGKIVGPGNAYVAESKRQVFGQVGIDMIAGPSEILVVADGQNDPSWIAADLLSQAEHDANAQAVLITDDASFAAAVSSAIDHHLEVLPRADVAGRSWEENGAVIVVRNIEDAVSLVDYIAPEHLELALSDPQDFADKVRNAGAIFLGRHTPEAIGDYVAGPNHVLPTSRSARFSSGLNVLDFMKRTTLVGCDPSSLNAIGPSAVTLAQAEGLDAHALSVAIRMGEKDTDPGAGA